MIGNILEYSVQIGKGTLLRVGRLEGMIEDVTGMRKETTIVFVELIEKISWYGSVIGSRLSSK